MECRRVALVALQLDLFLRFARPEPAFHVFAATKTGDDLPVLQAHRAFSF
jgi:hypothetical protein